MKDLVRLLCTLNSEPLDDYQNRLISDAVERLMQSQTALIRSVSCDHSFWSLMILKPGGMGLKHA